MKKYLLLPSILLFIGCAQNQVRTYQKPVTISKLNNVKGDKKICFISNGQKGKCILRLEAKGVGIVPCGGACSTAQAKAMARRAAIVDAYRVLAEKMYGIRINGRDTVKNMILQNSTLRSYVYGLIRGAEIVEEDFKDGTYTVYLQVKLDPKVWNEYIKNSNYYSDLADY